VALPMKLISSVFKFVVTIIGAALLAHTLYTTELGGEILRVIPDSAWSTVYQRLALEGAETTANAELSVWLVACFLASATLVFGGSMLLRHFFNRQRGKAQ